MVTLYTWIAIVVLIAGSLAVFAWFLWDVARLLSRERWRRTRPPDSNA